MASCSSGQQLKTIHLQHQHDHCCINIDCFHCSIYIVSLFLFQATLFAVTISLFWCWVDVGVCVCVLVRGEATWHTTLVASLPPACDKADYLEPLRCRTSLAATPDRCTTSRGTSPVVLEAQLYSELIKLMFFPQWISCLLRCRPAHAESTAVDPTSLPYLNKPLEPSLLHSAFGSASFSKLWLFSL